MSSLNRQFGIAVIAGALLHVGIYWAAFAASEAVLPANPEAAASHWFAFWVAPWLQVLFALVPGFVTGLLSRHRPMLAGFTAVFFGQLFVSAVFESVWGVAPWGLIGVLLVGAVQSALFGLAAAAAGFLVRSMRSNYVLKPMAGIAAGASEPPRDAAA